MSERGSLERVLGRAVTRLDHRATHCACGARMNGGEVNIAMLVCGFYDANDGPSRIIYEHEPWILSHSDPLFGCTECGAVYTTPVDMRVYNGDADTKGWERELIRAVADLDPVIPHADMGTLRSLEDEQDPARRKAIMERFWKALTEEEQRELAARRPPVPKTVTHALSLMAPKTVRLMSSDATDSGGALEPCPTCGESFDPPDRGWMVEEVAAHLWLEDEGVSLGFDGYEVQGETNAYVTCLYCADSFRVVPEND